MSRSTRKDDQARAGSAPRPQASGADLASGEATQDSGAIGQPGQGRGSNSTTSVGSSGNHGRTQQGGTTSKGETPGGASGRGGA